MLLLLLFVSHLSFAQQFKETFEKGIRGDYWAIEGMKPSTSTSHSISGKKSYRSWLPARQQSNPRSEIRFRGASGVPNWHPHFTTWGVKFAIYFPKDFKPDNTSAEILAQFHSVPDKGDKYTNPPWALRLRGTQLTVTNRWIQKKIATNADKHEKTWNLTSKIVPGKWHYFTVDIHWDYRSSGNGFMKCYYKVGSAPSKSDLKINHKGPTGYNDRVGSYFKLGIYKWDWKDNFRVRLSKSRGVTERELFYDDFEIKKNGFGPAAKVNKKPVADAGSDVTVTLPQDEITISGSGSDEDGEVDKYKWTKISGPSVKLKNTSKPNLKVSELKKGTYTFRLTVTDNDGANDTDEMKLTVKEKPNSEPVANAGPNITITLPKNSTTIEGSAKDDDDDIDRYRWRQVSGPTDATLEDVNKPTLIVKKLKEGKYVFELKVFDKAGADDTDRVIVTVEPPENTPPTANAGKNITITLPTNSVTIEGKGTDNDDGIDRYRWRQVSGPSDATLEDADKPSLVVKDLEEGKYSFELKVFDKSGEQDSDRVIVTVEAPINTPPTANAGKNLSITLPTNSVTIEGKGTDIDDGIDRIVWSQSSGPTDATLENEDQLTLTVKDLVEGNYVFKLKVYDKSGALDTDHVSVEVIAEPNQKPTVNAGDDVTTTLPKKEVVLEGTAKDEGGIESYQWTKVSGPESVKLVSQQTQRLKIQDLVAGDFKFKLTVTDNLGATNSDQVNLKVLPPLTSITADIQHSSCDAADGFINLSHSDESGPYTYQWSNGATTKNISNITAGDYEVTIIDKFKRSSTKSFNIESANAEFQVTSEITDATCSNNNGAIKVEISGGQGPYTYEWSTKGRTASLNQLPGGSYSVVVSDQNGCTKKFTFEVDIAPEEVTHQVNSSIEKATCAGGDGSIALNVVGDQGPYTYTWDHGASGPSLQSLEPGSYTVTIRDVHGCYMKSVYSVDQLEGLKTPEINQLADSLFVSNVASSYQWFKNDVAIAGANTASLKISGAGNYSVEIGNEQNCRTISDPFFAKDPENSAFTIRGVNFYPNPSVNDINVRISLNQPAYASVAIYDLRGRLMLTRDLGTVNYQVVEKIAVDQFPAGAYLIRTKVDKEVVTQRFLKY